jgi:hypothetical protein
LKENNLYDAVFVAEREKAQAKPGPCPRFPLRQIENIRSPIPSLERGTGSGKVPVRIALCGVSRSWRQQHSDEFNKYAHLLNMKEATKPDISAFLTQHPVSGIDGEKIDNGNVKLESGAAGVLDLETGAGSGEAGDWANLFYDGEEESGAILEMPRETTGSAMAGEAVPKLVEGLSIGCTG